MNDTPSYAAPPPPVPPPPPPVVTPPEPLNPWFSIWVQPRATMRQVLDANPRRMVHRLALTAVVVVGMLGLSLG